MTTSKLFCSNLIVFVGMVPVSDVSGSATASILLRYSLYATPLPFVAWGAGLSTVMFPLESIAVNGYLVYLCAQFHRVRSPLETARRTDK